MQSPIKAFPSMITTKDMKRSTNILDIGPKSPMSTTVRPSVEHKPLCKDPVTRPLRTPNLSGRSAES